MIYLNIFFITLLLIRISSISAKRAIVGIPVPGRTVPAYNIFELYKNSCGKEAANSIVMKNLDIILKHSDAEALTERFYRNLFYAIGELDINKLMGKWYVIIDTPSVHNEKCGVINFEMIDKSNYISTFSIKKYSKLYNDDYVIGGYGEQFGPDPGQILFNFNHPNDSCPYILIKLAELNDDGEHEYMILSQPMKSPTIVLARNPSRFLESYGAEIGQFLEKQGFTNPQLIPNATLEVTKFSECSNFYNYEIPL
uniref:Lipocalin domain-containing protein n=1 Tax=Parastrongyloides trichosuri TaxID=131310 RepID=A0A0N4Z952_PARTI